MSGSRPDGRASRPGEVEPYAGFAAIYDRIMAAVDYESWADYVETLLQRFGRRPRSLIDLACGTGSSALPFAARGYRVAAVDLSEDMLQRARSRAAAAGFEVDFYRMDLRSLSLPERYDAALLFQDGLNYLLKEEDLLLTFEGVRRLLQPGGLFIFDLTRPALRPQSEEYSLCWAEEPGFTLLWESRYDRAMETWEILLTVFVEEKSGLYRKFQERHLERDYPAHVVEGLLERAGFSVLETLPTFKHTPAGGSEPKLTVIAGSRS